MRYKIILEETKKLEQEFRPIRDCLINSNSCIDNICNLKSLMKEVLGKLTVVSGRKLFKRKLFKEDGVSLWGAESGVTFGCNNNGLGYIQKWGNNLTPLNFADFYGADNFNSILAIIKNDELVEEIKSSIRKENEEGFTEVVNYLRKITVINEFSDEEFANQERRIKIKDIYIHFGSKFGKFENVQLFLENQNLVDLLGTRMDFISEDDFVDIELMQLRLIQNLVNNKEEVIKSVEERNKRAEKLNVELTNHIDFLKRKLNILTAIDNL